jgi:NADPH-dependent curcumin reductase CurA
MSGTYRAIQLDHIADSFRAGTAIVTLPVSAPAPDEIVVRNHWAGVNAIFDTQFALGKAGYMSAVLPSFTGVEAAGIIEAVGRDVTEFAAGDAVASMRFRSGYREVNIAPASQFARLPDASRESLSLASTGVAALLALEHAGQLRDGETVAVSAAAGGLGHMIVQLAKLRGCKVVAVCGGEAKARFVASLGADRVIDYRREDVADILATEWRDTIDVAVDTVGGGIFDAFAANLAPHGRLVVSGAAQDMDAPSLAPRIALAIYYKAARIQAFQNGLVQHLWPGARARLFALHAAGALRVTCDADFRGLEAVYDAIDHLLSGRSAGKVLVDLDPIGG